MKRIVADVQKCLACRACEIACALAHVETDDLVTAIAEQGAHPRIYIESAGGLAVPLQCRHCEDAPCMRVCPSEALVRPSEAEPVLVNPERCIGCGYCVQVCPFGVIQLTSDQKGIVKCDLCTQRQVAGLQPACVLACPVAALSLEEVDERAERVRAKTAARVVAGVANTQG